MYKGLKIDHCTSQVCLCKGSHCVWFSLHMLYVITLTYYIIIIILMIQFASIVTWSHVILFANQNDSMNLRSILRGFGWPRQDDGGAAGGQILLLYLHCFITYHHILQFVLDPFTEFCFVHMVLTSFVDFFFCNVPRQETTIIYLFLRERLVKIPYSSWWIEDGQHDQNHDLSYHWVIYQCPKDWLTISSPMLLPGAESQQSDTELFQDLKKVAL